MARDADYSVDMSNTVPSRKGKASEITDVTTEVFLTALSDFKSKAAEGDVINIARHLRKTHTVDQRTGLLLLHNIDLIDISLENVILSNCDLTGSRFDRVTFGGGNGTSLYKANLTNVTFTNTTNTGEIDARVAILKNTYFENATLGRFYAAGAQVEGITVSDDTTITNVADETTPVFSGEEAKGYIAERAKSVSWRDYTQSTQSTDLPAALRF